jgi:hypothetical protein
MRLIQIFVLYTAFLTLSCVTQATPTPATQSATPLGNSGTGVRLKVSVDHAQMIIGKPVVLKIMLQNMTNQYAYVGLPAEDFTIHLVGAVERNVPLTRFGELCNTQLLRGT